MGSNAFLGAVVASPFAAIWTAIPWPWSAVPVLGFLALGAFVGICLHPATGEGQE